MPRSPILKYVQGQRLTARQLRKLQGKPNEAKRSKEISSDENATDEVTWEGNEEDF